MEETGEVDRVDTVGAWDLVDAGTIAAATGFNGNCLHSTGANSDVEMTSITFPSSFTITCWAKSSAHDWGFPWRIHDASAIDQIFFEWHDSTDYTYGAATSNYYGGASKYGLSGDVTAWAFLAMRTDSTDVRCRRNATDASTITVGGWSGAPAFTKLEVAKAQTSSDAYVDEMGMWDRELTDAELTELYNAGAGKFYRNGSFGPAPGVPLFGFHGF